MRTHLTSAVLLHSRPFMLIRSTGVPPHALAAQSGSLEKYSESDQVSESVLFIAKMCEKFHPSYRNLKENYSRLERVEIALTLP